MKKPESKSNYFIVGRIPGDDDVGVGYNNCTRQAAIDSFVHDLYAGNDKDRKAVIELWGEAAFIEFVLHSDSPIENVG